MPASTHSYLTDLTCTVCGAHFAAQTLQHYCPACSAPLAAQYDLPAARAALDRDAFARRPRGMWRWAPLMPVQAQEQIVSLGEGDTPVLALPRLGARLGLNALFLKDESLNPTGTFKARGLSAAVSRARELGAQKLIIPTAGNAGGALAAYASRAGLPAHVLMPADTPLANQAECRMASAQVTLVDGLISDAGKLAGQLAAQEDWFDVSTFKEPYRLEGKKTMGYEIAEQFGWRLPQVILYPAGGGMGLAGIWKAFTELEALGWLESPDRPRMIAVQAAGCAPFVKAFEQGARTCEFWEQAHTHASGLRVPRSFGDRLTLDAVYASGGLALAVSEAEIDAAQRELGASEGIFAAPEGAANVAALRHLRQNGQIQADEQVVLLNTGSGLKYLA